MKGLTMKTLLLVLVMVLLLVSASWAASFTWLAPGDDGGIGTATEYDLRVSLEPITEDNWASATQIEGEPVPSTAGTQETIYYYFAMTTEDEIPNVSGLSNVVVVVFDPDVFDEGRADLNNSGQCDISDLIYFIDYMFGPIK